MVGIHPPLGHFLLRSIHCMFIVSNQDLENSIIKAINILCAHEFIIYVTFSGLSLFLFFYIFVLLSNI